MIVEEVSKLILIILVAILILQIVTKGNGIGWLTSFFSVAGQSDFSAAISKTPPTTVAASGGSGFSSNAGAGQGVGSGGGGSW